MNFRLVFLLLVLLLPTSSQSNFWGKLTAGSLDTDGVTISDTYFTNYLFGPNKYNCTEIIETQSIDCKFHGTIKNNFRNRTVTQVIVNLLTYGCPDECTLYEEDTISLLKLSEEILPGRKKTFTVDADYNRTPHASRSFYVIKVKGY